MLYVQCYMLTSYEQCYRLTENTENYENITFATNDMSKQPFKYILKEVYSSVRAANKKEPRMIGA